mmetsp:Transcript_8225/g.16598  ORF Transcript_8225/g.16598 Transcript_8225/m.16598 type:complete len:316 (+) Transcript_8225:30-977(+)
MKLRFFRRLSSPTVIDALGSKAHHGLDVTLKDLAIANTTHTHTNTTQHLVLRLPCPLPDSLPPIPQFNLRMIVITPTTLSSFSDILTAATFLTSSVDGPSGRLTSHRTPVPSHVTGFNFDLDSFSSHDVAELIDTFPPVRLSSSCALPSTPSSSSSVSPSSVSYEGVMLYDTLSESIEHVSFTSSSSSPLLLQSAWAKQAMTGVSETFVTVDDDEGEEEVRSLFEEGRAWREKENERMQEDLEEWKSKLNSPSYINNQVAAALEFFDLSPPLNPIHIRSKFNSLAKVCHPDQGGNISDFLTLRKHLKTLMERYDG